MNIVRSIKETKYAINSLIKCIHNIQDQISNIDNEENTVPAYAKPNRIKPNDDCIEESKLPKSIENTTNQFRRSKIDKNADAMKKPQKYSNQSKNHGDVKHVQKVPVNQINSIHTIIEREIGKVVNQPKSENSPNISKIKERSKGATILNNPDEQNVSRIDEFREIDKILEDRKQNKK